MLKKLLDMNKLIRENLCSDLYIYGTDWKAWQLFIQCCSLRICIKGFVEEESDSDYFFHKKIYKLVELKEKQDVLLVPAQIEDSICYVGTKIICDNVLDLQIRNEVNRKIVIYGAGCCGRMLYQCLKENHFDVINFIQSEVGYKSNIDGISVLGVETLRNLSDDVIVICAGKYYEEMYSNVQKYTDNVECYYVEIPDLAIYYDRRSIVFDRKTGRRKDCIYFASIIEEFFSDKSIWLYGGEYQDMENDKAIYELLGYSNITIAGDDDTCGSKNIIDYIYEDNAVIFLYNIKKIHKLEALGLAEGEDYVSGLLPGPTKFRQTFYDINIGQAYRAYGKTEGEYVCPGVYRYGMNKKEDFIIMVLGGSTSDESRDRMKTWPFFLYEKLNEIGKNVTIYNCATAGYNSAQELIRYLRDGAIIKPNLVISYTGINDLTKWKGCNFNIPTLRYAGEFYTNNCNQDIAFGMEDERSLFDIWLDNLHSIRALARDRGAEYIAFAQPGVFAKKNYCTKHEKNMVKMLSIICTNEEIEAQASFRENCKMIQDDFIVNFTDIFDDEDVYYDSCHTYERGNIIIASKIFEVIEKKGILNGMSE